MQSQDVSCTFFYLHRRSFSALAIIRFWKFRFWKFLSPQATLPQKWIDIMFSFLIWRNKIALTIFHSAQNQTEFYILFFKRNKNDSTIKFRSVWRRRNSIHGVCTPHCSPEIDRRTFNSILEVNSSCSHSPLRRFSTGNAPILSSGDFPMRPSEFKIFISVGSYDEKTDKKYRNGCVAEKRIVSKLS